MAGKSASITFRMIQDGDEICQTVTGRYTQKDGEHILAYTDHAGNMHTRVILRIGEDSMHMKRIGALQSVWLFKMGTPYLTDYRTPFGNMLLEIRTQLYRCTWEEEIRVHLEYDLYQDGSRAARNVMYITIVPEKEKTF